MHKNPTFQPFRPKFLHSLLLLIMASTFFLLLSLFSLSFSAASFIPRHHLHRPIAADPPEIHRACNATRYPDACQSMLTLLAPGSGPVQIIDSALRVSAQHLETGQSMVKEILDSSAHNPNRSRAARTCLEVLGNSDHRTQAAAAALSRGNTKDARAWASAALCYQYDCWSGLKYVNDSQSVNKTMSFFNNTLLVSTSNALSMMGALDELGDNTATWGPPKTERDGFWEKPAGSGQTGGRFKGEILKGLMADVTVCKDGKGKCYKTVQDAVNAAPSNLEGEKRFVIKITEGVYEETVGVPFEKKNLVFIGDGMGKTVITGSLNTGIMGITTYNTAALGVLGDGFMASGLTVQNTAGPDAHQAVAFRSDSDFSYIENCEFIGNQDTIYVHSLRQLFKNCRIEGNVDFIFGNAAAIFQDCTILIGPRQSHPEKGGTNAISAHGRTDPAQTTGFVFLGCTINGTDEYVGLYLRKPSKHKNYLGRPWKEYSRTVYINCTIGSLISPDGWLPWSKDFALSTLYYGEFGNTGPGANLAKRVPWSSRIPAVHVDSYSVTNFLQGDE